VYSQGWSVNYSTGYGSYQLNDIKNLLRSMPNNYGLKETDFFPDYITHTVSLGYVTKHSYLGSQFTYLTTGGRLSRADYSGSYTVDMIMNGYRVGAFYRQYIHTKVTPLNFYLQLGSGALISNLKMKEQVVVYSESVQDNNSLNGIGMYVEPSVGASYRLSKYLHLSLGAGYEADFFGKLKYSGQETQVVANWSGFRLYGGLIIILPTKKIAQ
jgi:hypothetical protein